ncbi:hypothetical protein Tco_0114734, partial [Tanacetum coccineum]
LVQMDAQTQGRHEHDQEFYAEITTIGAEVDDIIEETFIPVWESIQDFVPTDSKLESERFKRPGTLLEKERAKRLKTVEGSEQQYEGNKDVKENDSDDHDKIINLQQWVLLVRQESSVDITPSVFKAPIYDWKIFKDKLREVYHIFKVGQAPKAYPYF